MRRPSGRERSPAHRLHYPAGTLGDGEDSVVATPEQVGLRYAGLRVLRLQPGASRVLLTAGDELAVVPLSGSCTVATDGFTVTLEGRADVFARVTDFAYIPRDSEVRLSAEGCCEIALPSAHARRRLEPAYGDARAVPIEILGAGTATRQKSNFLSPESFPADRLCACEVLTPDGNWSSYPSHKHDDAATGESVLEEIYYYRLAGGEAAWGCHRTYDPQEGWDVTVVVHSDDVFLVPRGFHGPCMAAPGYPMWYLNVLAGPQAGRSFVVTDDPEQHWIRATWLEQARDPRVPMATAEGPQ